MTAILSAGNVSVHSESPVDTANLLASHSFRNKSLDPTPQLVVESLINNPIEIVG
jgi:hypothetical protein